MDCDLEVLPTVSLVAEATARRFVAIANDAIHSRGEFVVALSGGSTQQATYERLAAEPGASNVEWSRVQVLWSDERCVPPDHAASTSMSNPLDEGRCRMTHGQYDGVRVLFRQYSRRLWFNVQPAR